jgi:hypothetical protein
MPIYCARVCVCTCLCIHMTHRYACCHQTGADVRESWAAVFGARKKLRTTGLLEEERRRTAVLHDSTLGSRQTPNRKEFPQYVSGTSSRVSWMSFAWSVLKIFWFSGQQLCRIRTSGPLYRTVWSSDLVSQVHAVAFFRTVTLKMEFCIPLLKSWKVNVAAEPLPM